MRKKLICLILRSLRACDGMPQPETALVAAAQLAARPEEPTAGDVREALKDAEAEGYAEGVTDPLAGRSWTLTTKGEHQARKL